MDIDFFKVIDVLIFKIICIFYSGVFFNVELIKGFFLIWVKMLDINGYFDILLYVNIRVLC